MSAPAGSRWRATLYHLDGTQQAIEVREPTPQVCVPIVRRLDASVGSDGPVPTERLERRFWLWRIYPEHRGAVYFEEREQ